MYILASSIKIKKSSFGACLDPLVLIEIVWIHLLTCFWIEKKTEPLPPGVSRPEALIASFSFAGLRKYHKLWLFITCHWQREAENTRHQAFYWNSASSDLSWERGVELPTCNLHNRRSTTAQPSQRLQPSRISSVLSLTNSNILFYYLTNK